MMESMKNFEISKIYLKTASEFVPIGASAMFETYPESSSSFVESNGINLYFYVVRKAIK